MEKKKRKGRKKDKKNSLKSTATLEHHKGAKKKGEGKREGNKQPKRRTQYSNLRKEREKGGKGITLHVQLSEHLDKKKDVPGGPGGSIILFIEQTWKGKNKICLTKKKEKEEGGKKRKATHNPARPGVLGGEPKRK